MTRIIYDTSTGKTHPYPRADDAPIVGLDPALVVLQVIREPPPGFRTPTQASTNTKIGWYHIGSALDLELLE